MALSRSTVLKAKTDNQPAPALRSVFGLAHSGHSGTGWRTDLAQSRVDR